MLGDQEDGRRDGETLDIMGIEHTTWTIRKSCATVLHRSELGNKKYFTNLSFPEAYLLTKIRPTTQVLRSFAIAQFFGVELNSGCQEPLKCSIFPFIWMQGVLKCSDCLSEDD
jgi:hypothetical protein